MLIVGGQNKWETMLVNRKAKQKAYSNATQIVQYEQPKAAGFLPAAFGVNF